VKNAFILELKATGGSGFEPSLSYKFDYRYTDGPPTPDDGNQQIIFDAFSTSGNSGSPVFLVGGTVTA
jgi:hypothetical protein